MLKTVKVKYFICSLDYVTVDITVEDFDCLLWNNEGLYKLFPVACFRGSRFIQARWSDGYQIPAETARLILGE